MSKRQLARVVLSTAFALVGLGSGSARAQEIDELFNLNPPAAPQGIALGADHNLWFVERLGNRVGRITPQADVTEFSAGISPQAGLHDIAAGPDGNLWFTEFGAGRIGRITPAGVVTEFSASTSSQPPAAQPFGIAAGPDGNLWFTDPTRGVIGRITPGGLVTSFSDGLAPGAVPVAITRGPDGNMWFTEAAGRIGRITMSGVVTEFGVGIPATALLQGITAGPDGNVWFTESAANRIGRITPAGVVTEFGNGITPASDPRGIALGPDGNLWFTEHAGNRIGRITPAGVVTEFGSAHELTPAAGLYGIAVGPGPDLWFTEETTDGIGKITVGTALHLSIEPARPTATDDILVRSLMPPGGCRLLDSPFRETRPAVFEGLVFVTTEPDGCAADDTRPEARLPLRVTAGGRYHVVLWKITGSTATTPETPETRADADVTVGDAEWLIPAAARTEGANGAHWTTDLEIFSANAAADTPVTLTFLASGGAEGTAPQATIAVPPFGSVRVEDVLDASFGIPQGSGAILLTSPSLGLRFAASIGTNLGGGRIAQNVPAVPGREKLRTGQSAVLYGIREDEAARTNLAIANAGGLPAVVDLALATGAASPDATTSITVPARGMTQVNRVVRALGVEGPVAGKRLTVTARDAADGVAVLATVIDNATNSPRALRPE